jgi:PBSX family phage terminase large subunit
MFTAAPTDLQQPHYVPHGVLAEAWACHDPLALVDGPAGTGKSRMWLERIDALARKYPGSRHFICRKTRKSITTTAQVTFENFVLPARSGIKLHKADQVYPYPNGSIIGLLGLDDTEKTKSLEADTIYINEATECAQEDVEMLIRSLRWPAMPWKQIAMDCNPDAPTHWLFKAFSEKPARITRFVSRHKDNPYLWHQELQRWTEKALGDLFDGKKYIENLGLNTGVRLRRLLYGEWCAAEGVVYDTWDDATHVINWFRPPNEWPRYWSVDFGYTDPFCLGMWTVDPDGRLILYKHIYFTQRLVEDHAETIKKCGSSCRTQHLEKLSVIGMQKGAPHSSATSACKPPRPPNTLQRAFKLCSHASKCSLMVCRGCWSCVTRWLSMTRTSKSPAGQLTAQASGQATCGTPATTGAKVKCRSTKTTTLWIWSATWWRTSISTLRACRQSTAPQFGNTTAAPSSARNRTTPAMSLYPNIGAQLISDTLKQNDQLAVTERTEMMRKACGAYQGTDLFSTGRSNLAGKPDDNVAINYSETIVDKGVSFLFGDDLKITAGKPESTEADAYAAYIEQIWPEDIRGEDLLDLGTNGGIFGHVWAKIAIDAGVPSVVVGDPECYTAEWAPDNYKKVVRYLNTYRTTIDGKPVLRRENTYQVNASAWQTDLEQSTADAPTWTRLESYPWPFPFAPVVHCKNLPTPNQFYGKPDLTSMCSRWSITSTV